LTRVIIPVAGVGKRLRPHTISSPKALIEVAGKPILGHILDGIASIDSEEVVFIVGPMGESIEKYVRETYGLPNAHFIHQETPLGLGHAIYLAQDRSDGSPVLILLGDTIFDADIGAAIARNRNFIGLKEVPDPGRFGVVELDGERVVRLVEKPDVPPSNLAVVGIYYFTHDEKLFSALEETIQSGRKTRGEFQLTDALQLMVDRGEDIYYMTVDGWYDCGKPETLLATQRYLLGRLREQPEIPGSVIIPPVFIHETARISRSIIGPYVSISEGVVTERSILSNSIVRRNSVIKQMSLDGAIIGQNADLFGFTFRMQAGDSSQLDFSGGDQG